MFLPDEVRLHKRDRFFSGVQRALKLSVLYGLEHGAELRTRFPALLNEIVAGDEQPWPHLLLWRALQLFANKIVERQIAVTAPAIEAMKSQMLVEMRQAHEAFQR